MNIRLSTKDSIQEAAFQLFKDNPRASLAEIAKLAGVGRVTLHRYFSGREELVLVLTKLAIQELDDAAEQAAEKASNYTEAIQLMLHALVPLADRQWFLANQELNDHPEIQAAYLRQNEEMRGVIDAAKNEGSIDASLSSVWVSAVFDSLLYAAWELVRKEELTTKQAAEYAWSTLMKGVGASNG